MFATALALTLGITPMYAKLSAPPRAVEVPPTTEATVSLNKGVIRISGPSSHTHVRGLRLRSTKEARTFVLANGIYTFLRFTGSRQSDKLVLEPSAVVITNTTGGGLNINFGKDTARDVFVFTNTVDVPKQSAIFGRPISPFNHMQRVVITNFGREDQLVLQGQTYTYNNIRKDGTIHGISPLHIRVKFQ